MWCPKIKFIVLYLHVAQGTEDSLCNLSKTSASVLSVFPNTKKTDETDRMLIVGSRDGAVVRELATNNCGPGSIPCVDAMWVELVVGSRPCSESFPPGTPFFLPPQKPTFPNSNSTWKQWIKEPLCGNH